jgi:hypothetical protein
VPDTKPSQSSSGAGCGWDSEREDWRQTSI